MRQNRLLKPCIGGFNSGEMTLKFHSYCCVNVKYHLKNALMFKKKKMQQFDSSCGYSGTFYSIARFSTDKQEQLPLSVTVMKAAVEMLTFFLKEKVFILFLTTEEKLYLLKSIQTPKL